MEHRFICPISHSALIESNGAMHGGQQIYPIKESVPIIVPLLKIHEETMLGVQSSIKGDWFTEPQVAMARGPYKLQVGRRKKVVDSILTKEMNIESVTNFLDIGCGDGFTSNWVLERLGKTCRKILVDYNLSRINRAKSWLAFDNLEFAVADCNALPFEDDSFDLIFSHHVIEHVPNDQRMLSEVFRVLKPGGKFLLGCPTEGIFFWMLAYTFSPASIRKSDHLHFYNDKKLIRMLQDSGLNPVFLKKLGYGVPHWRLDTLLRQFKLMESILESMGKFLYPSQASSIYILSEKAHES